MLIFEADPLYINIVKPTHKVIKQDCCLDRSYTDV